MKSGMDFSQGSAIHSEASFEIAPLADCIAESRRASTRNGTLAAATLWEKEETLGERLY
jgi:hypothetical protein